MATGPPVLYMPSVAAVGFFTHPNRWSALFLNVSMTVEPRHKQSRVIHTHIAIDLSNETLKAEVHWGSNEHGGNLP